MKRFEDFPAVFAERAPALVDRIGVTRLLAFLLPTAFALYANFQGVQLILAPIQVEAIDSSQKIGNLALLTVFCAITGVAGLVAGGAVTDATRGRWGRRAPWLAGMAASSAILAVALGFQRRLGPIAALYAALWFTLNFFQGAMLAVLPDRVPVEKRSLASSIMGVGAPVGALIGVNLAAWATSETGYAALATMLVATTASFVILAREGAYHSPAPPRRPLSSSALSSLRGFRSHDFSVIFVLRTVMFVAQFSINNYLLYILQDHIGARNLPAHSGQIAAGALSSLRILVTIFVILGAGWFAARTRRRKAFVEIYAFVMAAANVVPIISPNWLGMLIFAALGGVAMGVYSAVDLDMMAQALPDKNSSGRDLAVLAMAGAAAQFLAPTIGGGVIKLIGYDALFGFAAIGALGVGAAALRLRSVR
jgi:MFS family permease